MSAIDQPRRREPNRVAVERVASFAHQFGEAHLTLACHAAFPLALTPDLLYRIWADFVPQTPWIAAADVLLSRLCHEVGYELYEMEATVRNLLLRELKDDERFGQQRLNELADFLTSYVMQQLDSEDSDVRHLAQAQQWMALAYTRPSVAAGELALTLSKLDPKDEIELFRVSSLVETFAEPLADFSPLLVYARGMMDLSRGNWEGAKAQLGNAIEGGRQLEVAGVVLHIPYEIIKRSRTDFDQFTLTNMPSFLAVNYQQLSEAQTAREQVELVLHIYNSVLRFVTISVIQQYLIRDRDKVSDPYLNQLLLQKFPHLTLDAWQQLLFAFLRAYEGKRDLFFMPELYDFYWDTSTLPHRQRVGVEAYFNRLTQIALEVTTGRLLPRDEADWQKLANETTDLLRQVLQALAFIGMYDLIRVVDYDERIYDFELHKGLTISIDHRPLPPHVDFTRGWFYMRKSVSEFLLLYPLLVFWEGEADGGTLVPTDIGVYDRFVHDRLQYLLATLGKTFVLDKSVKPFVTLLYDTIEEAKRQRQVAEKLTWWQLRDICADITHQRMATVQNKYRKELYLQRDKMRQAFERFLKSDKRCFVLTGKSGVGKSNFLLALNEDISSRPDMCVLMYDGTQLKVEPSISNVISRDFDDRLVLGGQRVHEVWREIAKIEGIQERLVLLVVDAINENPDSKELLRQLDELARQPWPWLKVVFSSRPETWQAIRRGVKLAEPMYYREEGSETLGVEFEPFSYSEQMEPFSRQELPEVYAKHQQVFNLQTPYEALTSDLRQTLREPLNLWLVARTYQGKAIPDTLKITGLIDMYVDALLRSERLQKEDLRLLEKQLVPLMVREGHYSNAITISDIDAAGVGLYEAVYSEQVLSDGRRMNQSYTNLLDTEILARVGKGRDQEIAFRYERFYEYFVGKALFHQLGPQDSWERQYNQWIAQLSASPFLWGAVESCLEGQMQILGAQASAKLCIELARIKSQRILEILIAALTEYGEDYPQEAQIVIMHIFGQEKGWLSSFLGREVNAVQCPPWKRVGIEVASNLGMAVILESALTDPSPAVRSVAIRHAFVYWWRNRAAGFGLLENLMDEVIGLFGLPVSQVFESCVGLSLLILFEDFKNIETTNRLQEIWRRAIERMLRVDPKRVGSRMDRITAPFRATLINTAVESLVRIAEEVPSNSTVNVPELSRFFMRDGGLDKRRATAHKLVEYFDQAKDVRDLRHDVLALASERDIILSWLSCIVMCRHGVIAPRLVSTLMRELFERAVEVNPPGPFAFYVPTYGLSHVEKGYMYENRALFLSIVTRYLDHFQGRWWSNLMMRRFTCIDLLCFAEAGDNTDIPITPIARSYVEKMIADKEYAWMRDIIQWEVTMRAVEMGQLRFAFSVLEMLVGVQESHIREAIIELLARTRVYYPDEVDDFMELSDLDERFIMAVRTRTPSETIGDLLELRALTFWDEVIMTGSPKLWQKLIWLFGQLVECRSLAQWLAILLKTAVNQIYGGPVFTDVPA